MLGQRSYRKIFGSHPSLDPDLGILKNYFYYGEIAEISNRNLSTTSYNNVFRDAMSH